MAAAQRRSGSGNLIANMIGNQKPTRFSGGLFSLRTFVIPAQAGIQRGASP
jgi:hypothetical protein